MNTYRVVLIERTEHVVKVKAPNKLEAQVEAEEGWKEGYLVDSDPVLLEIKSVNCVEVGP